MTSESLRTPTGKQQIPRPQIVRPGKPAPWAELPSERRRPTLDDVRRVMANAPEPLRASTHGKVDRASAVLAALYGYGTSTGYETGAGYETGTGSGTGEAHVVLTRRAQHLRSHRGEVSFPGGGQDPGEDLWFTALREAREEIALDSGSVTLIGELDHLRTMTSASHIVPYVGILPGRPELLAAPDEVESVLHVSLSELLDLGVYREELWFLGGEDRPIFFFEIEGDTIWGATAAMLRNLLSLVTGTFDPEDRPTPWANRIGT